MTDEEMLLIELMREEDDADELFTMLEIIATLYELGAEYRAQRDRTLVPA